MSNARWTPRNPETQTRCQNCEEPVLPGTARVFGDNSGTLHHCGSCTTIEDLGQGAGANPDYKVDTHRHGTTASDNNPMFATAGTDE